MRDDARSDHELLEAFQAGDAGSFESLYERHRDWTAAIARRFTRDAHAAMDVLQDAFAYVLMHPPELHAGASFRSFMYPVIKHTALASRRKLDRGRPGDIGPTEATEGEQSGAVERAGSGSPGGQESDESLAQLRAALDKLPDPQREVLVMRAVDGLSLQEIAFALSIPLGTVKSRLHNALGSLHDDHATRRYFEPE